MAAAMVLGSCGGKQQAQVEETEEAEKTDVSVFRDQTIYGVCTDGTAMNTLQLITDEGDTVDLSIGDANDRGLCFGGFQSGDRMAVILEEDETTASQVINLTALTGDWVTSDPANSPSGIRLKEDGVAENIGDGTVEYRSWRLFNGRLLIECVRDGATETGSYEIVSIGPDSLVFKDNARRFEFSRK